MVRFALAPTAIARPPMLVALGLGAARSGAMRSLGASRPRRAVTGETAADPGALLECFEPLRRWLEEQNEREVCGW
ncbi:M2 family metallopeptidase [Sorangium sp. KYC3313]|uniref:M2 family metallopeptidase n=1 Tax=Sorangium sp. KYC3313 TaxID=3449740 RepID=UPI003F8A36C7